MLDLISIGDSVIDIFVPLTDARVEEKELILRFGDKIPVGPSQSTIGGNAANNSIGSARLKLKTAVYTNIGGDPDADRIKAKFKDEGVDTRYIVAHKDIPSAHHIVLDFKDERTILTYHTPWDYDLPDLEQSKWIYLTSLAPSFIHSNIINQLVNYLERSGAHLVYNPGTFQIKSGVKKNSKLLSLTELFIVNKEEAKVILGLKENAQVPIKKLLKGIADLGPRLVIITDGEAGSFGFDGEKYLQMGIFPAKIVQKTGSGDAYACGALAALFYGKDLKDAMRWGSANGASVTEQNGPQAGLLSYAQMQDRLKENDKITPKEI